MKRSSKLISLILAVIMLMSSISAASVVEVFAATDSISYSFSNSAKGYAQGTVTLKAADGTYYLYWADSSKALEDYSEVAKLTVSGGQASLVMPKYTAIPADATKLIAIKSASAPTNRGVSAASAVYNIPASKQLDADTKDALYTFGSISDPQLANDDYGSDSYPYDEEHLAAALETLANRGVDFTVSSGDTVNDQNGNKTYAAEYKAYQRLLADSSYCNPIYEANGNHDVGTVWDKNGNYYNNNTPFVKATGLNNDKSTIAMGKPYFEVTEPNTGDHFIFMALEGGFYTNKGTQFSTAQLDWLEGLLKKYSGDGKNIFIIEHANIGGWGSGDKLTTPYYYDLALIKTNPDVARFIKLMESYKDCVIITGHTHLELSAQYNYSDNNGTSAVMIHNSAIGGVRRLVNGTIDRSPVQGLSEGYIVEVYEDQILFNGTNMVTGDSMPQCCYIVPMTTSEKPEDETTSTEPADDTITITLKDTTDSGWMSNNASEREIQLIDNDTNTKYIMTSYDGYKTWIAQVPRTVKNITFKRVRMSDNVDRNVWSAGQRGDSVQYNVLDDAGGGTTAGAGYWDTTVTEPATTKVPTDPAETQATTLKPVVTEPIETQATATNPQDSPSNPVEMSTATEPIEDTSSTAVSGVLSVSMDLQVDSNNIINATAVATGGTGEYLYQFFVNGVAFTEVSSGSKFACQLPVDGVYSISVVVTDGSDAESDAQTDVKVQDGEVTVLEATEPAESTASELTTAPTEVSSSEVYTTAAESEAASTDAQSTSTAVGGTTQATEPQSAPTAPSESVPEEKYLYGDADTDGKINIKDVTAIQKYAAKLTKLDAKSFVQADVTGDTKVNIKDATAIQKYCAKIISVFPVEETAVVSVGAALSGLAAAKQDLDDYYTFSSYNQYMALKKMYRAYEGKTLTAAQQNELTTLQNALYDIAGARPSANGEITIYFTNTNSWSKVYAHIWGSAGDKATWPGTAMTFVREDSSGKGIYKITFDYEDYQKIIFNNGNNGEQTVDITLSGESGIGYYLSGGSGKAFTVTEYTYS